MNDHQGIAPGTLELYVMGALSKEESHAIRELSQADAELRTEIAGIEKDLEALARAGRVETSGLLRARIMEKVRTTERFPSLLRGSTASDFSFWMQDIPTPSLNDYDNIHATALACSHHIPTELVWVKSHVEEEAHTDVLESFLLLEGTCEVVMPDRVIALVPGDVMKIPLNTAHSIRVTSIVPCKAIVQRQALAA